MTHWETTEQTRRIDGAVAAWLDGQSGFLRDFYGMMRYEIETVGSDPASPREIDERLFGAFLCLLSAEAAGWMRESALRASAALALLFASFRIHDDIERHHTEAGARPTLWTQSGMPQAINTGDGLLSLAANAMLDSVEDVDASIALARELAGACMTFMNGQHVLLQLEIASEPSDERFVAAIAQTYGTLGEYSAWVGAVLGGAGDDLQARLRAFGAALGTAVGLRTGSQARPELKNEVRRYADEALGALQDARIGEAAHARLEHLTRLASA